MSIKDGREQPRDEGVLRCDAVLCDAVRCGAVKGAVEWGAHVAGLDLVLQSPTPPRTADRHRTIVSARGSS